MLDLKFVRSNPQLVAEALVKRGGKISLDGFLALDEERRSLTCRNHSIAFLSLCSNA